MRISIILVNYRGWKKLRLCLDSLRLLKGTAFSWEAIIVDNQSADNQLPFFAAQYPEFRFIENDGNFGFANGCNRGAREASGEYLFFLNPDTIVTPHAIKQLLTALESNPEITILSCKQVNDQGKDTRPYGLFMRPATLTSMLRSIYRLTHKPFAVRMIQGGYYAIFPEWVSGSAILISQRHYDALQGWDEDYWMYYEDADLCKRATARGGRIALLTDVRIIHNHGGASRINEWVKSLTKSEVLTSKHVYIHKHFQGSKRFAMQAFLVLSNLFMGPLLLALAGIIFFFVPALRASLKLYLNILHYYRGVLNHKTWLSQRSVNFKQAARTQTKSQAYL